MKNISDYNIYEQLDMLLDHIKKAGRVPKIKTSVTVISEYVHITPEVYINLSARLLKDGLILDRGSETNGTYVPSVEAMMFEGYVKQQEQKLEKAALEKEEAERKRKIELSQIKANESSIRTNKNVMYFSILTTIAIVLQAIYQVLQYYKK